MLAWYLEVMKEQAVLELHGNSICFSIKLERFGRLLWILFLPAHEANRQFPVSTSLFHPLTIGRQHNPTLICCSRLLSDGSMTSPIGPIIGVGHSTCFKHWSTENIDHYEGIQATRHHLSVFVKLGSCCLTVVGELRKRRNRPDQKRE